MRVREYEEAARFVDALRPLWEPREAELNLMLGIALALLRERSPRHVLFASLEQDGTPVGAVVRTSPAGFVVAASEPHAAAALARHFAVSREHGDAPSVVGSRDAARAFAEAWSHETKRPASLVMAQRILALSRLAPPPPARGRARLARIEDAETIATWLGALEVEAMTPGPPTPRAEQITAVRRRIGAQNLLVWETDDEALVSMALLVRPTPNGVAVTGVYTPPEHRGRGYASCCVAAISQRALASGKRFTCLYTDANNATSNALYERIGYRFVCGSEHWSL